MSKRSSRSSEDQHEDQPNNSSHSQSQAMNWKIDSLILLCELLSLPQAYPTLLQEDMSQVKRFQGSGESMRMK